MLIADGLAHDIVWNDGNCKEFVILTMMEVMLMFSECGPSLTPPRGRTGRVEESGAHLQRLPGNDSRAFAAAAREALAWGTGSKCLADLGATFELSELEGALASFKHNGGRQ